METLSGCTANAEGASIKTLEIDLGELETIHQAEDSKGYTMQELCQLTGHSQRWVSQRLNCFRNQKRLTVGRRTISGVDGRLQHVPVYRW